MASLRTVTDKPLTLRARWVVPLIGPPLAGGGLRIAGGRIVEVVARPGTDGIDLGDVALWPGLVNAHTHLEFSLCRRPLCAEAGFSDWIRQVVAYRSERLVDPPGAGASGAATGSGAIDSGEAMRGGMLSSAGGGAAVKARAVAVGLCESWHHGVALVGEIATAPYPIDLAAAVPFGDDSFGFGQLLGHTATGQLGPVPELPARRIFAEGIAPVERRAAEAADQCQRLLASLGLAADELDHWRSSVTGGRLAPGLSPHAPYTVHPRLLAELLKLGGRGGWPLAMHLAETSEEIEWLHARTGPLADMRDAMGLGNARHDGLGSIAAYLELLAGGKRVLVVHGNYLDRASIDLLARHRERMAVVYCPRTHAHFGHPPHPVDALLRRGVSVLLGTDSRASNPDLSILAEARQLMQTHPWIDPWQIVDMITCRGARWLGAESYFGSFRVGSSPGINVIASRQRRPDRLAEELLAGGPVEPLTRWLARH